MRTKLTKQILIGAIASIVVFGAVESAFARSRHWGHRGGLFKSHHHGQQFRGNAGRGGPILYRDQVRGGGGPALYRDQVRGRGGPALYRDQAGGGS